jgi:hypothetical protein
LRNAHLEGDLLDATLAAVDGRKTLRPELRERLVDLQQRWDDRYLDVQDSLEAGEQPPAEALEAFHRARALDAVLGALEEADGPATTDIVYEAIMSGAGGPELVSVISEVIE